MCFPTNRMPTGRRLPKQLVHLHQQDNDRDPNGTCDRARTGAHQRIPRIEVESCLIWNNQAEFRTKGDVATSALEVGLFFASACRASTSEHTAEERPANRWTWIAGTSAAAKSKSSVYSHKAAFHSQVVSSTAEPRSKRFEAAATRLHHCRHHVVNSSCAHLPRALTFALHYPLLLCMTPRPPARTQDPERGAPPGPLMG